MFSQTIDGVQLTAINPTNMSELEMLTLACILNLQKDTINKNAIIGLSYTYITVTHTIRYKNESYFVLNDAGQTIGMLQIQNGKAIYQKENSQKEVSQRETSQKENSQEEITLRETSQKEISQKEITQHEASQQEISLSKKSLHLDQGFFKSNHNKFANSDSAIKLNLDEKSMNCEEKLISILEDFKSKTSNKLSFELIDFIKQRIKIFYVRIKSENEWSDDIFKILTDTVQNFNMLLRGQGKLSNAMPEYYGYMIFSNNLVKNLSDKYSECDVEKTDGLRRLG